MRKATVSGLVVLTAAISVAHASKPSVRVVPGAKALTKVEKARVSGKAADWKLPIGHPVPPGQFPPGNSQLKPGQQPGNG